MTCADCGRGDDLVDLYIVAADYGQGAFLKVLCKQCDHRRWYRAELLKRKTQATPRDSQESPRE